RSATVNSISGPSTLNEDQIAERGARMARRDDREYREYLSEEQRSQPGCPAREVVLDQRGRATSPRHVQQRRMTSKNHVCAPRKKRKDNDDSSQSCSTSLLCCG